MKMRMSAPRGRAVSVEQLRTLLAFVLVSCFSLVADAQIRAGTLDSTFSGDGKVGLAPWTDAYGEIWGMRPQHLVENADGSVITLGYGSTTTPLFSDAVVSKLLPNGSVDTGFGVNGYAFIRPHQLPPYAAVVAAGIVPIAGGGGFWLLLQGAGGSGAFGIYVMRIDATGAIDRSIGVNGSIDLSYGGPGLYHHCRGTLQKFIATSGGRMLALCVESTTAPNTVIARLLRLNANGTLDSTFGVNGEVAFPATSKLARLTDFLELADGSFVGTGPRVYGPGGVVLQKVTASGLPFPGFGANGTAETDFEGPNISGRNCDNGFRIVADGTRFIVLGTGGEGPTCKAPDNPKAVYPPMLIRTLANGSSDTSFGDAGRLILSSPADRDVSFNYVTYILSAFAGLHVQPDGRIIAITSTYRAPSLGYITNPGYNVLVVRVTSDGILDTSYGTGGRWYDRLDLNARPVNDKFGYEEVFASLMLASGKLLVGGWARYGDDRDGGSVANREYQTFYFRLNGDTSCYGFDDVSVTDAFCQNIDWLKSRGVTLGCGAGQFCPDAIVNRSSMAAFMNRLGAVIGSYPVYVSAQPGALTLQQTPVVCITPDLPPTAYPQHVTGNWWFSGKSTGKPSVKGRIVASSDLGMTWHTIAGAAESQLVVIYRGWGHFGGRIDYPLAGGVPVRLGIRLAQGNFPFSFGTFDTDSTCQMSLSIHHRRAGAP